MANPKRQLIINYIPGEECRVAVVNNGRLDEFYSEKRDSVSHVGNIYVGRVTNVEPAIQAAFVDFGLEQAGFLHASDLHPYYFPGEDEETTERVGKKTPRRERPPIQECLKRGQEIVVQVLKEGVGSKGPTVTSYLSIPGRYLVMMPQMDNVGVSRKVEDEGTRARMKEILDQLELPEGFGFIVRTAGLDKTKAELKRDLAYLMRLQKDMERRRKAGTKPRLLYSESDLLLRALRDMLTSETHEVVIDDEVGCKRAARFMHIFSPRSETKLMHYAGKTPIYHALGVEEQIRTMYAREVPLPSGGRLVIDETEALVAIDVNSGKSRSAGDSEENAYQTNLEAVDEICRQLRLRDLGGIVINDLIDMRSAKHRREVEEKVEQLMTDDRARSTVLPLSEFGIMQLTRQRMRGSHESVHFHDCPTCRGRGLIQRPESVAADALRDLAGLLDHEKVQKAEMVVNPRVAAELLSHKRKALSRIERHFGKSLMVRLSDATPIDRVTFYAYDESGNDIEIDRLPKRRLRDGDLQPWVEPELAEDAIDEAFTEEAPAPEAEAEPVDEQADAEQHLIEQAPTTADLTDGESFSLANVVGKKKRRRGRGGRDRNDRAERGERREAPVKNDPQSSEPVAKPESEAVASEQQKQQPERRQAIGVPLDADGRPIGAPARAEGGEDDRKRRRRRGRGGRGGNDGQPGPAQPNVHHEPRAEKSADSSSSNASDNSERNAEGGDDRRRDDHGEGGRRRRRRGRGGRGGNDRGDRNGTPSGDRSSQARPPQDRSSEAHREPKPESPAPAPAAQPAKPLLRTLYGAFRKLKPGQLKGVKRDE